MKMRTISKLLVMTSMVLGLAVVVGAQAPAGWTLVWSDEFNGTALDTTKWAAVNNCGDQRNSEQECYMADDVSVANGLLTIKSERRSQGGFAFTSGAVKTGTKFTQANGRFEFSARLPPGGQGIWPALWLYPTNQWPPEIDVLEAVNDMSTIYQTYHWGASSSPQSDGSSVGLSNLGAFHVFAVEWEPNAIRWYIDGVLTKTHTGADVTAVPMQLYINTALGGSWPGSVGSGTAFPQTMDVDYVRVYTASTGTGDTTAPTVSVTSPAGGATVSGTTTVTATAADNVGVSSVWFTIDGTTVGAEDTAAPYQVSWNTTTATNGTHLVRAVAQDAAGNTTTSNAVSVTVSNTTADTTAPTVSVTAPGAGATVTGTVSVTATAADNVGVASVQFTLDGINLGAADTTAPYATSWTTTGTSNGTHTVRAVARDAAGNTTTSTAVNVTVSNTVPDTTAPTVSLTAPAGGTTVSGTVTVTATAADNVGVAGVQFTLDGANLGTEDTSSPFSTSWTTTSVANGTHTLAAIARDAAGNKTTASSVSVTVNNADTTAPTISLTAPAGSSTVSGVVNITATAADNVGVAGVQFMLDGATLGAEDTVSPFSTSWTTTSVANGPHTLTAIARDAAGNKTTSGAVGVTVNNADTTAPTVSITAPAAGSTVSGTVNITASATDNVGVVGVQFTLDGANLGAEDTVAPYAFSWPTSNSTNGSRVLRAIARDAAGNITTSAPISVTVANTPMDTTAPTVSVTAPATGSTVSGVVTVSASATDNTGVAGVQFTLDGVNLGAEDTAAPFTMSWTTNTATNGTHTLRAVARDAAGNTSTSGAVTVTVNNTTADTTPPTVSLTAPASGATVSGTVAVTASASDNVGVVGVQFTLDGVNLGSEDTVAPYTTSWSTTGTANGAHTLRAVARDAAGNTRTSTARTVTINNVISDTVAPSITLAAPLDGGVVAGNVILTATSSDNVGVVGVQFAVDGVAVGVEDTAAPYTRTWAAGAMLNGPHVVTATARDAAGNTRTATSNITLRNLGSGIAGDMDDDGDADLVFENASGQLYTWFMAGGTMTAGTALAPSAVNPVWQIVGLDDFDGDKKTDILWQNTVNGQVYLWLMDHQTLIGESSIVGTDTPLSVVATGDFNGDGKADILWRDPATGALTIWYMNGSTVVSTGSLTPGQVDPNWRVVGTADLNHDGKTDLIWQNRSTGSLYYWLLNGGTAVAMAPFTPGATDVLWEVRAVGDFNGDGQTDLIFQHASTGQLYVWYLNGTTLASGSFLNPAQINPAWRIMGGR